MSSTQISDVEFQKSLIADINDFLPSVREQRLRHFFIGPDAREEVVDALIKICPESKSLIIQAADKACEHKFDLLGSGPTDLGWPIDWHADFRSGFRWDPAKYYADIRAAPYPGGYDVKVPWELSRCQHFIWLGQAYWLSRDEKFAIEFRAEVEDWIRQNPPEMGVNWACSMDVAIRAVNWLWGYAFFQTSPSLNDDFMLAFYKSLLSHGRHISANLEWTATFTGNHYLSDIIGLIYLGILLPEFKEAETWRKFGFQELEREMFRQVYLDGVNFEASVSYHRLVTELFLSATLLARLNGHSFPYEYMKRLEAMLDFIHGSTKPDGTAPLIGDQDNGRLHRLKVWADPEHEWLDFRYLLAAGSILFDRPDWGKAAGDQWEEAIWLFGREALSAYQRAVRGSQPQVGSQAYQAAGVYILRADDLYVAVDLGPIGQNGKGGHAHNDSLSFELYASGQTWILDPGTYMYTSDYEARNLFRSTGFHNTLVMSGYEQNSYDHTTLFSLKSESFTRVLSWQFEPDADTRLAGEVQHLREPKIAHRRSFRLSRENRTLLLSDRAENTPLPCQLMFHFAPELHLEWVDEPYRGIKMISPTQEIAWMFSISTNKPEIQLKNGWVSRSYGNCVPGMVASIELISGLEHRTVIVLPGNGNIPRRIDRILNHEDSSH